MRHADAVRAAFDEIPDGGPVLRVHGDLHVGQVLRAGAAPYDYRLTDFDGNPVVAPAERIREQPAAVDVAGMAQSFTHAGIVTRKHNPDLDPEKVLATAAAGRAAFLDAYRTGLGDRADCWTIACSGRSRCGRSAASSPTPPPTSRAGPTCPRPRSRWRWRRADMDPALFLADLHRKPASLRDLAARLRNEDPWAFLSPDVDGVVLLGMGSSAYAGGVAAARLRARGVRAVCELASSDLQPQWGPGTTVVAISATGGSRETLAALDAHLEATVVAADQHRRFPSRGASGARRGHGGRGRGGRRRLPHLPAHPGPAGRARSTPDRRVSSLLADVVEKAADASEHLLATSSSWLPEVPTCWPVPTAPTWPRPPAVSRPPSRAH